MSNGVLLGLCNSIQSDALPFPSFNVNRLSAMNSEICGGNFCPFTSTVTCRGKLLLKEYPTSVYSVEVAGESVSEPLPFASVFEPAELPPGYKANCAKSFSCHCNVADALETICVGDAVKLNRPTSLVGRP